MAIYMLGVLTKHPPEKLEYWRRYRRENAMRCREQRSQWREASGEKPIVNVFVFVHGAAIIASSCVMDRETVSRSK